VFIADCFLEHSFYREPFDRYWHTRIGTITEYLKTAEQEGLETGLVEDISRNAAHFWTTTLAFIEAEAHLNRWTPAEARRRDISVRAHTLVWQGLASGGLRYALISFSKREC
jgi:hypothetical protein